MPLNSSLRSAHLPTKDSSPDLKRHPAVAGLIAEHQSLLREELEPKWRRVRDQYRAGLSVDQPQEMPGGKVVESKLVFSLVKKVAEKISPPLYSLDLRLQQRHLEQITQGLMSRLLERDPEVVARVAPELTQENGTIKGSRALASLESKIGLRRLMRLGLEAGLSQLLRSLRLTEILYGPEGVHHRMSLLGNAFLLMKDDPHSDAGVSLSIGHMRRLCFPTGAHSLRGDATERNAQQMAIVLLFRSREEAKSQLDPASAELLDRASWGLIPEMPEESGLPEGAGHVVLWYTLEEEEPAFRILAGPKLEEIFSQEGNSYPYYQDETPLLPVVQFGCFGQMESLYHAGVGEYASQIANGQSLLRNALMQRYIQDSHPLEIIDIAAGYEHELGGRIERAQKLQKEGKRGIIINPSDELGQQTVGGVRPLFSGSRQGLGDYQLLSAGLETDTIWLGVNMRNVATEATKTAAAVQMETAAQTEIAEAIRRANATAYRELLEILLSQLRQSGRVTSQKPLANSELEMTDDPLLQLLLGNMTLGDVVWTLREIDRAQGSVEIALRDHIGVEPSLPQRLSPYLRSAALQRPQSTLWEHTILPEAERSDMLLSSHDVHPQNPPHSGEA